MDTVSCITLVSCHLLQAYMYKNLVLKPIDYFSCLECGTEICFNTTENEHLVDFCELLFVLFYVEGVLLLYDCGPLRFKMDL